MTIHQWLKDYATSHQNKTNKLIHWFCVPIIFFSVYGLLSSIPSYVMASFFSRNGATLGNLWKFCAHICLDILFQAICSYRYRYASLCGFMCIGSILYRAVCNSTLVSICYYFCCWLDWTIYRTCDRRRKAIFLQRFTIFIDWSCLGDFFYLKVIKY